MEYSCEIKFGPVFQQMLFKDFLRKINYILLGGTNHLCNFGRGHNECEIILNLDQKIRGRWRLKKQLTVGNGQ